MLVASHPATTSIGPAPMPVRASTPANPPPAQCLPSWVDVYPRPSAPHRECTACDRRTTFGPVQGDGAQLERARLTQLREAAGAQLEAQRARRSGRHGVAQPPARAVQPGTARARARAAA